MSALRAVWVASAFGFSSFLVTSALSAAAVTDRNPLDFSTGGECLFCHRGIIGTTWQKNAHNRTVHETGHSATQVRAPDGAEFALGARKARRWLKTTKNYGVLAMRTAEGQWDESKFGKSCAGCHTSGVEPKAGAFAAISLDCFVCHGDVSLEHANNPGSVHLSPRRDDDAKVVVSICGQCHLRGGRSQSTGRFWPKSFVAGDALLDDFQYDFSNKALRALSIADRHVAQNVRDVALKGKTDVTCLSCHSIHGGTQRAHRGVPKMKLCFTCHIQGKSLKHRRALTRSSAVCGTDS